MNAVVLFSHGSLLCGAGEALRIHADRLRMRHIAPIVEVGYLNYSEPPFLQAVSRCAAAGASRIIVAPYFLVPGYFVSVDLPKCVEVARAAYPDITFITAAPIGFDQRLADALLTNAKDAASSEHWHDELMTTASHCRPFQLCPIYGTPACPKRLDSSANCSEPHEP